MEAKIALPRFAVVHFGATETDTVPFFMKANSCFTANEHSEYIAWFEGINDAREARARLNSRLKKQHHPLAGHLFIMQLGLIDVTKR